MEKAANVGNIYEIVIEKYKQGKNQQKIVKELVKEGWPNKPRGALSRTVGAAIRRYERTPEGRKKAIRGSIIMIIVGLVFAVGGTAATIASYKSASEPGDVYYVFWGAIIFGIADVFVGIGKLIWLKSRSGSISQTEPAYIGNNYNYSETATSISARNITSTQRESSGLEISQNAVCPVCAAQTTLKTVKKGPNTGRKFFVCNNYPRCKGKVPVADEWRDESVNRLPISSDGGKSKVLSIVLAIFFSFFAWLYTYRKNWRKFWVGFILYVLTIVLIIPTEGALTGIMGLIMFVVWIWAIVDTSTKSNRWYRLYGS